MVSLSIQGSKNNKKSILKSNFIKTSMYYLEPLYLVGRRQKHPFSHPFMDWKCASMHSARNFFDSPNRLWAALTALEFYLVLHRAPMFSFFSGLQIIWHQVTLWLSIRTWKCICETVHIQFRVHPRFEYKVPVIQIKGQLYQNSQKAFVFNDLSFASTETKY